MMSSIDLKKNKKLFVQLLWCKRNKPHGDLLLLSHIPALIIFLSQHSPKSSMCCGRTRRQEKGWVIYLFLYFFWKVDPCFLLPSWLLVFIGLYPLKGNVTRILRICHSFAASMCIVNGWKSQSGQLGWASGRHCRGNLNSESVYSPETWHRVWRPPVKNIVLHYRGTR